MGVKLFSGLYVIFCIWGARTIPVLAAWHMVYPSGFALATFASARVPPPPPLLSMMIDWPRYFSAPTARARKLMSALPPAANDIKAVIGLSGNSARAKDAAQNAYALEARKIT